MESLKALIENIPDWIKRLDDINGQIEQRQLDLARFAEPAPAISRSKSVRNKGSTESLKPQDEGAIWKEPLAENEAPGAGPPTDSPTSPSAADKGKSPAQPEQQQQTNQIAEMAQARARALLRKRNKRGDSLISVEGPAPKYRTRSMIIVYYDSYVQSFFEELVKFVSAQRNTMRKAKMAAKVAQIKRMAELEMPAIFTADDDDSTAAPTIAAESSTKPGGNDTIIAADTTSSMEATPALNYKRTMDMRSPAMLAMGRPMYLRSAAGHPGYVGSGAGGAYISGSKQRPDVYDDLDKGLEYVQSMCEHAAHQFLRDGVCHEEIASVKRRLVETKEKAEAEMERAKTEGPAETITPPEGLPRTRNFRPLGMRKDASTTPSAKEASVPSTVPSTGTNTIAVEPEAVVEVDANPGIIVADTPQLMYKSSRLP